MKWLLWIFGALVGGALLVWLYFLAVGQYAIGQLTPDGRVVAQAPIHYRVVLTFRSGEEDLSFGAVISSRAHVGEAGGKYYYSMGTYEVAEATPLDLPGEEGRLFATLRPVKVVTWPSFGSVFYEACKAHPLPGEDPEGWLRRVADLRGRCELAPEMLPVVLRFKDPLDPTSASFVDLTKPLPSGARLVGAYIEPTSEPPHRRDHSAYPRCGIAHEEVILGCRDSSGRLRTSSRNYSP